MDLTDPHVRALLKSRGILPEIVDEMRAELFAGEPVTVTEAFACRHCGALVDASNVDGHRIFHAMVMSLLRRLNDDPLGLELFT